MKIVNSICHMMKNSIDIILRKFYNIIRCINYSLFKLFYPRRILLYTCITGEYDNIVRLTKLNPRFDYICFTNNRLLLKKRVVFPWSVEKIDYKKFRKYGLKLDLQAINRAYKLLPHLFISSKYSYSLYIDGNVDIISSRLYKIILNANVNMIFKIHPYTKCTYDEINQCMYYNKDSKKNLLFVYNFLKLNNFPRNYGLFENNIIFRKHSHPDVIKFCNEWYKLWKMLSKRDQLSIMYAIFKFSPKYKAIKIDSSMLLSYSHN